MLNKLILLLFSLFLFCLSLSAQLNFGVGFSLLFPDFNEIDKINASFNSINASTLEVPFQEINSMAGINLGLRYSFGTNALLFNYENADKDVGIVFVEPGGIDATERKYFYNIKTIGIGIENRIGRIIYGGLINKKSLSIKTNLNNTDVKRNIQEDRALSLRLFAGFIIQKSDLISLEIRPFYDFTLDDVNISNYANHIDGSTETVTFRPGFVGVKLVFYNGRQF